MWLHQKLTSPLCILFQISSVITVYGQSEWPKNDKADDNGYRDVDRLVVNNGKQYFYNIINNNRSPYDNDNEFYCKYNADCDILSEMCDGVHCVCKPFFYRAPNLQNSCVPCPTEGYFCTSCCYGPGLECVYNECVKCQYFESTNCMSKEEFYILTAAQVTMIGAFAFLIVALCGILYHRCTKNSYYARRRRALQTGGAPVEPGGRVSVTSLQQGVLERMRDRPPKYETRHNYTHNNKAPSITPTTPAAIEGHDVPSDTRISVSQISSSIPSMPSIEFGIAPPCYDPAMDNLAPENENPPPYTPLDSTAVVPISTNVSDPNATTTVASSRQVEMYQKLYGNVEGTTSSSTAISDQTNSMKNEVNI